MELSGLHRAKPDAIADTALGQLAEALRVHFCNDVAGVLLQPTVVARLYPVFASLATGDGVRTVRKYKAWVRRLASREYADELVLVIVATELQVRIVVVLWTPATAVAPWMVSSYPAAAEDPPTVCSRNNDVHYVLLLPQVVRV